MARFHRVGYPATWISDLIVDGEVVVAGHMGAPYEVLEPFTLDEEKARDEEERLAAQKRELEVKQRAGTISARETALFHELFPDG